MIVFVRTREVKIDCAGKALGFLVTLMDDNHVQYFYLPQLSYPGSQLSQ
jgi:hypothetical protein